MNEGEAFIRAEATKRGIDSDKAVTVAESEGGTMPPGNVGKFDTGWSFWPFQLHYGSQGYERFGTVAGMGNSFTAATGWQPGDPAAWRDSVRYALDAAKRNGWGAWYGAKARGITGYSGIDRSFYWPGTPDDEWDYRKPPTEPLRAGLLPTQSGAQSARNPAQYNPDAPVDPQPDDWSCSVQSAQWLLRSLGRNPGRDWLVGQLVGPLSASPIVSREYGLMDASGRTLAAWLQREYGDEMGVSFEARPVATWEDLVALASKGGAMLGGRTWGHWTGVRGYRDGKVLLANPAGSWRGVGQELTRDEYDALGSWTAIVPRLPAPGVGSGPATGSDEDTILGLRAAVAHLTDVVVPKAAAAAAEREAALAEAKRVREEFVGVKP